MLLTVHQPLYVPYNFSLTKSILFQENIQKAGPFGILKLIFLSFEYYISEPVLRADMEVLL